MSPVVSHKVILDTNVVIGAGSRWLANDPPNPVSLLQRLVFCVAHRHDGLYCDGILDEYIELMIRKKHPHDRITLFVAYIREFFTHVVVTSATCHTAPPDRDDTIFVLCALDGHADVIVSDDKPFLTIRPAYHPRPAILPSEEAAIRLSV